MLCLLIDSGSRGDDADKRREHAASTEFPGATAGAGFPTVAGFREVNGLGVRPSLT